MAKSSFGEGSRGPAHAGLRELISRRTKEGMAKPAARARLVSKLADPEIKNRQLTQLRNVMTDPSMRARISARTKEDMADPVIRERIREGMRRAAVLREFEGL